MRLDHLDNRLKEDMNNLNTIDQANKDHYADHDFLLSRYCQEYPRLALNQRLRTRSQVRPFGDKNPVHETAEIDNYLLMSNYEPGVWYYQTLHFVEHSQLVGVPMVWRSVKQLIGTNDGAEIYLNMFNRLRMLDFKQPASRAASSFSQAHT